MSRLLRLLSLILFCVLASRSQAACVARDGLARLHADEVNCLVSQALEVAGRYGENTLTVAVIDRLGNVLGLYQRGAPSPVLIRSGLLEGIQGLDNVTLDASLQGASRAAIAKAITAAYFSSNDNAFSTRTAGFIIQNHFPPGFPNTPGGPLFGVQFSQLACGDFVQKGEAVGTGTRASPLGVAADPGGFPLYKNRQLVGAIGVVAGTRSIYGIDLDPDPARLDDDLEERIAQSASAGFTPADEIRGDRVTAGGITLRYSDSDSALMTPTTVLGAQASGGAWAAYPGYFPGVGARTGLRYGTPASGFEPASGRLTGFFIVPRRDPVTDLPTLPRASVFPAPATVGPASLGLTREEVEEILLQSLRVARRTRSQIRRPLGAYAQVSVTVIDASGNVLGQARSPDALLDSSDVTLQKARAAVFFSRTTAADRLTLAGMGAYVGSTQTFFGRTDALRNGRAFSSRAIGSLHRPNFPDGIDVKPRGPLSRGLDWSPFNAGLELDLVLKPQLQILNNALQTCTSNGATPINIGLANGITIFGGGFPIYREFNGSFYLVGGIGASGDGTDQSDLIGLVGLQQASNVLAKTPPLTALATYRAPRHPPLSLRISGLKYAQCPQAPYLNSTVQNPCAGL